MKIILILVSLFFLIASCTGKPETSRAYPVFGKAPLKEVALTENQEDAFDLWLKKGYKGITIVHAGAYENFASGYLNPAARLGIVKKIYWIIPYRMLEYSDAERRIKYYLASKPSKLTQKEIGDMKLNQGCVSGRLLKTEVNICSPESLPFISEPVILDINANFFQSFSSEKGIDKLRGLKEFFDVLVRKQVRVFHADIVLSGNEQFLMPVHRYIGHQVADIFKKPELLKDGAPPELWSIRENADNMLSAGGAKEVIEFLKEPLKKYPEEESLIMFNSIALVKTGKYKEALAGLELLCRRNKNLCGGLIYAGSELREAGRTGASELFFRKAAELRPDLSKTSKD